MADDRVKILFDENISHAHVDFVAKESRLASFEHIRGRGWSGQKDVDWIPRAVQAGFIVITGDRNEKTREYTTKALKKLGARFILLGSFFDHLNRWEKAKWIVTNVERLVLIAQEMGPGQVVLLHKRGPFKEL